MLERAQIPIEPLEGKVAQILNDREVVINRGSKDGVETGMKFKIVESLTILDPDTDEELGSIERENIRVKVIDVQPAFAIAHTYQTYQALDGMSRDLFRVAGRTYSMTKVRTIRSSEDASAVDAKLVRIGDKVVQVDEYEETPVKQSDNPQ